MLVWVVQPTIGGSKIKFSVKFVQVFHKMKTMSTALSMKTTSRSCLILKAV